MSPMMEAVHQDTQMPSPTGEAPSLGTAMSYRIKRTGARPLNFQGSELAMAMSYTPALPYWYEINLYRTTDQRFVLAIRLFYQSEDAQDTVQAWEFESIDEALAGIESYDAAQDVKVSTDIDTLGAPAELAAAAMDLRAQTQAARAHFATLSGEFFHEIETDA